MLKNNHALLQDEIVKIKAQQKKTDGQNKHSIESKPVPVMPPDQREIKVLEIQRDTLKK